MFTQLSKTSVFKGFKTSEIIQLLNETHFQVRKYEQNEIIAYRGDSCGCIYILFEGSIRGEMYNYSGKNVVISKINAPDTFAEGFLFADRNSLLIDIIAETKTSILVIQKPDLQRILENNHKFLSNYLNVTSNRFVVVTEKIKFLMMKSVKAKLAVFLLDLENENPDKEFLVIGKTHKELAALFGIARPVLTRNLLQLKSEGFIEIDKKNVRIIDREGLTGFIR